MKDIFKENQRIIILQGCEQDNDFSLSNEMLQRLLKAYGHGLGLHQVNEEIHWLERKGLLSTEEIGNGILIAKLTRSGIDIARGNSRMDGIDRPLPE